MQVISEVSTEALMLLHGKTALMLELERFGLPWSTNACLESLVILQRRDCLDCMAMVKSDETESVLLRVR